MAKVKNDFVIEVATVNGSGSQSSNNILVKSIFRMGVPVSGKNLFPSNIQGLATWYSIRLSKDSYTARRAGVDISMAMNVDTILKDIKATKADGFFFYNSDLKFETSELREDVTNVGVPFKTLIREVTDKSKLKKLLVNMIYVGVLAELLQIDEKIIAGAVTDQFKGKESVVDVNLKAIQVGQKFAREAIKIDFPYQVEKMQANKNKILLDGNSASALGMLYGGCSFVAWYPITPSSSVVENFIKYAEKYRKNAEGKNNFAIVQAEDELSSIAMVSGAGWAGARALTATSGPGMSLMGEAAGLAYYAEVPAVIWNVQRCGPSTGLPTRTQQSDILSAAFLSHGDCKHILLLPADPKECFEFGQTCFDLAEELQTLVIVLSDLDVGMNHHIVDAFEEPTSAFHRGKVLDRDALNKLENFGRYQDTDGDGIPSRTLPGTHHPEAPYFTRGTGHDEKSNYTEDNETYKRNMDRLARKWETAKGLVPKPVVDLNKKAKVGIVAFGSSDQAMQEARDQLSQKKVDTSYLRLRAYPFTKELESFLEQHESVFVVDQNRDQQMYKLILMDYPHYQQKLHSILHYDGLPIMAESIFDPIASMAKVNVSAQGRRELRC